MTTHWWCSMLRPKIRNGGSSPHWRTVSVWALVSAEACGGEVSVEDYRINAFVRSVLVRRWIDTSRVDFGTSNGVVYLKGMFRQIYRRKACEELEGVDDLLAVVHRLEKDIRSIQGVRDVVFRLSNFEKKGGKWTRRLTTLV